MKLYKVNPELGLEIEDTFTPVDIPKHLVREDEIYFHRFVDGDLEREACNYSCFTRKAVEEELILIN